MVRRTTACREESWRVGVIDSLYRLVVFVIESRRNFLADPRVDVAAATRAYLARDQRRYWWHQSPCVEFAGPRSHGALSLDYSRGRIVLAGGHGGPDACGEMCE